MIIRTISSPKNTKHWVCDQVPWQLLRLHRLRLRWQFSLSWRLANLKTQNFHCTCYTSTNLWFAPSVKTGNHEIFYVKNYQMFLPSRKKKLSFWTFLQIKDLGVTWLVRLSCFWFRTKQKAPLPTWKLITFLSPDLKIPTKIPDELLSDGVYCKQYPWVNVTWHKLTERTNKYSLLPFTTAVFA